MNLKVAREAGNSGRDNLEQGLLDVSFLIHGPIGETVRGLVVNSSHMLNSNFTTDLPHLINDTAA